MNAYIKRMKTSTPEGRDRSAMGRGGGGRERGYTCTPTHKRRRERGRVAHHTHHSALVQQLIHSQFPYVFKIGVSLFEKRNVLRELRKEEIEFVSLMFLGRAFHRMVAI